MLKTAIIITGLTLSTYATQELSCVDFVNMSDASAKSVIENFRKNLKIDHFNTNPTEADKSYIYGASLSTKDQLKKCISLRKLNYPPNNMNRYIGFDELNGVPLTDLSEREIYENKITESKFIFNLYSSSSLIGNLCASPLVFFAIQNNKVYEAREEQGRIILHEKQLPSNGKVDFKCGNRSSQLNYLAYLNTQKQGVQLSVKEKNKNGLPSKEEMIHDASTYSNYIVKVMLYAKPESINEKQYISVGAKLNKIKIVNYPNTTVQDMLFEYNGEKYRVSLKVWKQNVKKGGN